MKSKKGNVVEYGDRRRRNKMKKTIKSRRIKSRSTGSEMGSVLDQNLVDCARRSGLLLYTSAFALRQVEAIGVDNLLTPLKLQVLR